MHARQMMLPRGNNRNCVKVNINREDDEEDIMMKMDMARAINENQQISQFSRPFEEKMEIEEPKPSNIFTQQPYAKKTQNEGKMFGGNDRRATNGKEIVKGRGNTSDMVFRGRDVTIEHEKQPLLSRNVLCQKIDQNNLNMANEGFGNDFAKNNKIYSQQSNNQFSVNRSHF